MGTVDEALAALRQERFELVMTDLRIAGTGQGGRSILEAARRRLQPVVIVSAAAPEESPARAAVPRSRTRSLVKPFQLDDMMALVERFLALRGELERLARERPPASRAGRRRPPGVQVLGQRARPSGADVGPPAAGGELRLAPPPGASRGAGGGGRPRGGRRAAAGSALFLPVRGRRLRVNTEKGCLAVSLALKG